MSFESSILNETFLFAAALCLLYVFGITGSMAFHKERRNINNTTFTCLFGFFEMASFLWL